MKKSTYFTLLLAMVMALTSCVSKKKFTELEDKYAMAQEKLQECDEMLEMAENQLKALEADKSKLTTDATNTQNVLKLREEQINDLKTQVEDMRSQRDRQLEQIGDLAVLSKAANENVKETLQQLEQKDRYIKLLQDAKSKADSLNLALAVNLKGVLKDGIDDQDIDIRIDKTVVLINLSDKMLFRSGSYTLTNRAKEVLGKIAAIIESRPDFEVMVEGYTDNVPIRTDCIVDNWDLSVKRSSSVVRVLQKDFKINPNRLIAAGRGEYNTLASNSTAEGRSINRRTRIIIMPKIDQFYDLLNPALAAKTID
ncbi:MAG TPA: OmpA family protein [Saprospiraceae bacterium]|nr:OmpA family protein [Saprospiraceae bacterium]